MPVGRCFSLELRLCPERLLGDELPPSLYPVPYLLGLPFQRLECPEHLSISGKGQLVGARGTAPEVVRYVILFPAHHGVFVAFITKYSTLLLSTLLFAALGTATSLPRPTSPPAL